jgi:hypothetical protein
MKIWWPWHKAKTMLSLFEGRVPGVNQPTDSPQETQKRHTSGQPHPQNALGDFYVEDTECMACGYPHVLAPDLMACEHTPEDPHVHCYFKKQPADPWELKQAIDAVNGSCCGALCYSGSDREILKRIS